MEAVARGTTQGKQDDTRGWVDGIGIRIRTLHVQGKGDQHVSRSCRSVVSEKWSKRPRGVVYFSFEFSSFWTPGMVGLPVEASCIFIL